MVPESIHQKLRFARKRLDDLEALIANNQLAADIGARHQLTQEFFFHLIGAREYLVQLVNERRSLQLSPENVDIYEVVRKLVKEKNQSDELVRVLKELSLNPRTTPLPADPYSDEGLIYRAINYRNEVVHRNTNPFQFQLGRGPRIAVFGLDPRDGSRGQSTRSVDEDLSSMFTAIEKRCHTVLTILG